MMGGARPLGPFFILIGKVGRIGESDRIQLFGLPTRPVLDSIVACECDRFRMAGGDFTEIDEREVASLIDNGIKRERSTQHPYNLQLLLMMRVAFRTLSTGWEEP
jgi:hypothetical protein